jgi:hypothetical protein
MAKPQGESKAPIVIALAVFVLLSLVLGVLFYMGMDTQAQLKEAEKKAISAKADAEKLARKEQEKILLYRELLGANSQEETTSLKNMSNKEEVYKEYKKVMQELRDRVAGAPGTPSIVAEAARDLPGTRFDVKPEEVLAWDWPEGTDFKEGPKKGLFSVVVSAYAKQLLASQKQANAEKNAKAAEESYQKMNAEYATAVQALKAAASAFPALVTAEVGKVKAQVDTAINKFDDSTKQYTADLKNKTDAITQAEITKDQLTAKNNSLETRVNAAEQKLTDREDPFAFEKHHGRITKRSDNIVYIDLGSADKVRAGLTFTIQPSDTPERGIDTRKIERVLQNGQKEITVKTKGSIEVIEVLGPNLSQARVTNEPDRIRDGILVGDTLYNAAWRKGSADRVALFGVFDTDADGTDDTKTLIRELNKMGIIVDAYYDLEQKKWIGNMTTLTNFVIEGYYPTSTTADGLAGAKSAITANLDAAKRLAQEKGIKIVKARDFLPRIGYRMRLDITPETVNRAFNKYLQATTDAPAEAPKN